MKPWICVALLGALTLTTCIRASAEDIDQLGDEILLRQIELEKLNQQIHLEITRPMFGREKRTWLWDFSNAIPTEGGLIAAMAVFYVHANNKTKIVEGLSTHGPIQGKVSVANEAPGGAVAGTLIPQIAGQVFGGAGSLFELGLRCYHSRRMHQLHLNRKSVTMRAQLLMHQIGDLESKFEHQALGSDNSQFYLSELKVLRTLDRHAIDRYRYVQGEAIGIATANSLEDSTSVIRNIVVTVCNAINTAAVLNNDRTFNGQGSILNLVAASMITIRPIVSTFGAFTAKRISARLCRKAFPELSSNSADGPFKQSFEELKSTKGFDSSAQIQKRMIVYELEAKNIAEEDSLASFEKAADNKVIFNRLRETIYGPTKMTQSIMSISSNLRKVDNPSSSNRISAASNTIYTCGQVYNIAELLKQRIAEDKRHAHLKKEAMLPEQRIARTISTYDLITSKLAH